MIINEASLVMIANVENSTKILIRVCREQLPALY